MKALVLEENGKVNCREHALRGVGGWCGLRIAAAGICGGTLWREFRNGAYRYPLVIDHELPAVVEKTPKGDRYAPGTRVTVFPLPPCGPCRTGCVQPCLEYGISFTGSWNSVPDPDWNEDLAHAGVNSPVTGRTSLEEASAAFDRVLKHGGFHCKTLVLPDGART